MRKGIAVTAGLIAAAVITVSVCSIANRHLNAAKISSSDNSLNTSSKGISSSSESKHIKINSTDNEELKQKKEKYNQLVDEAKKVENDYESKCQSGTDTKQDFEYYCKKKVELGDEIADLGIKREETDDEKYLKNVDGYIADQGMLMADFKEENNQKKYEQALRQKKYLEKVESEYKQGKISAKQALKSFDDVYNIK